MWKQWWGKPQNLSLTVAYLEEIWDHGLRHVKQAWLMLSNRLHSKTNWLPMARFRWQPISCSGDIVLPNCDISLSLHLLLFCKLSNCICYFYFWTTHEQFDVFTSELHTSSSMFTTHENKRAMLVSPRAVPCLCACVRLRQSCSVRFTGLLLRDGTVKMKVIRGVRSSSRGVQTFYGRDEKSIT
jgi:hypothetical protein